MNRADEEQLASCERRYRDLARKLAEIGWIASGSLALRTERCSTPTCRCQSDPERRHGPYWHFTAQVNGKTVNKRLPEPQAHLYEQWIANDRAVRAIIAEMRTVAAEAEALILADQASQARRGEATASPQTRTPPSRRSR